MENKFKRKIDSLESIYLFIVEFTELNKLDNKFVFTINLIIEELFTNMVKYSPGNTNDILISLSTDSEKFIVSMIDYDVEPFDIRETKEYDPTKPLEERRIGGVGIPLIKKIMDKIDYEYKNRESKITLIKYLENDHVRVTD